MVLHQPSRKNSGQQFIQLFEFFFALSPFPGAQITIHFENSVFHGFVASRCPEGSNCELNLLAIDWNGLARQFVSNFFNVLGFSKNHANCRSTTQIMIQNLWPQGKHRNHTDHDYCQRNTTGECDFV